MGQMQQQQFSASPRRARGAVGADAAAGAAGVSVGRGAGAGAGGSDDAAAVTDSASEPVTSAWRPSVTPSAVTLSETVTGPAALTNPLAWPLAVTEPVSEPNTRPLAVTAVSEPAADWRLSARAHHYNPRRMSPGPPTPLSDHEALVHLAYGCCPGGDIVELLLVLSLVDEARALNPGAGLRPMDVEAMFTGFVDERKRFFVFFTSPDL
ncbi:hypothetical protein T492DRAFT_108546 [Pavlovales sp. CCMP2436]|nr:hypothetical protein T492DRAFT_108546 [Pavlovales sp. CCMP2436]